MRREGYRIGVPVHGRYTQIFSSDAAEFGGTGENNGTVASTEDVPMHDQEQSIAVNLPSLSVQFYQLSARLPKRPKPEPEEEEAEETESEATEATAETAEPGAPGAEETADKPAPKKRATRAKKAEEPAAEEEGGRAGSRRDSREARYQEARDESQEGGRACSRSSR